MKSKMAAIFAVVVIALAATGAAYASWTATPNISGMVTMGNFNVIIQSATLQGSSNPHGTATVTYHSGGMMILMDNAFPGSTATALVTIKNTGSLPAVITGIVGPIVTWDGVIQAVPDVSVVYAGTTPPVVGGVLAAGSSQTFTVTVEVLGTAQEGYGPTDFYMIAAGVTYGVSPT